LPYDACMKKAFLFSLLFFVVTLIGIWVFYKPARIVAPELAGVTCISDVLCTDDLSRLDEAAALYHGALRFVDTSVGQIKQAPRLVFCSSDGCARAFGLGRRSAMNLGTFGIIVGPRAWKPYYVRHEMIHHLQNERLGMLKVLRTPEWFTEGMAYSLSEDPRPELAEPFEQDRTRFETWYKNVDREHLWQIAQKL